MTSTAPPSDSPLSEADIQAYADGTLTPERAAFLQDYLGKDPAEARRVAFYGRLNTQMQQAFQTTDEPVSTRAEGWRGVLERLKAAKRPGKMVNALGALVLTLVAASGWLAATQVSSAGTQQCGRDGVGGNRRRTVFRGVADANRRIRAQPHGDRFAPGGSKGPIARSLPTRHANSSI